MDTFEEHARLLKPKPRHAQILLEVDGDWESLEKALGVLERASVESFRFKLLQKELPSRVLIELYSRDMREAVRRLTEAGFYRVKGINAAYDPASPRKGGSGEGA